MTKVFIKTYGCSLNLSDSEAMAGILRKKGFSLTSEEEAEVIIINSCTVKDATEAKFFRYLEGIKKPVVITGCIAQTDPGRLAGHSLGGRYTRFDRRSRCGKRRRIWWLHQ